MTQVSARAAVSLGAKGRFVIPATVRRAAGIVDGAELVVRSDGPGRVVVETRDSVRARVWAAAPDATGVDATVDIRETRQDDAVLSDQRAAERSAAAADGGTDAGEKLLARLGLA